jgi:hypothetical protein
MVLNETGAVACLKQVLVVPRLPKTLTWLNGYDSPS